VPGHDSAAILAELGYSESEVTDLRRDGVVSDRASRPA
jgi:crotonobetainyl-CoA:carnitine CoA-transferase CaiB-like acyl-CoA transferase